MEKKLIFEMLIQELTEQALNIRRKECDELEKRLYYEIGELSKQKEDILEKLTAKDCQVIRDYIMKTNLIADRECKYLYVQGAKDCVEALKKLGIL